MMSNKAGNIPTPIKNWTRITMHEMEGFLAYILNIDIIKKPTIVSYWSTLYSQPPHGWRNVYQASLFPLAALLPPRQQ
jgi:hypothetical protein